MIISLGSNTAGPWGCPRQTLAEAQRRIERDLGSILAISPLYLTAPVGGVKQARFHNQIMVVRTAFPPYRAVQLFKRYERAAGRRPGTGQRWGSRPLDIDIIDHGGRIIGWQHGTSQWARGRGAVVSPLVLPHPRAHRRAFVLVPLLDVAPHWMHPVLGQSARRLLMRIAPMERRSVLAIDSPLCNDDL